MTGPRGPTASSYAEELAALVQAEEIEEYPLTEQDVLDDE